MTRFDISSWKFRGVFNKREATRYHRYTDFLRITFQNPWALMPWSDKRLFARVGGRVGRVSESRTTELRASSIHKLESLAN